MFGKEKTVANHPNKYSDSSVLRTNFIQNDLTKTCFGTFMKYVARVLDGEVTVGDDDPYIMGTYAMKAREMSYNFEENYTAVQLDYFDECVEMLSDLLTETSSK